MSERTPARPSDVALEFAPDINPILIEAFLEEAPVQASRFGEAMTRLDSGDGSHDDVVQAQRVAHSLKGAANLTGVRGIAALTHHAEDILDHLAAAHELPSGQLSSLLSETADCVASMVDALSGTSQPPRQALALLTRLLNWRELVTDVARAHAVHEPSDESAPSGATTSSSAPVQGVADEPQLVSGGIPRETLRAATAPTAVTQAKTQSLRVPTRLVDGLLKLAGELAISNVQAQGAHQRMMGQATTLREQYHLVQQRLLDMQDLVEIRGVPATGKSAALRRGQGSTTATGTWIQGFDPLELDEYNELHSKSQALAEAVTDFCEIALGLRQELLKLDDTIVDQQRISKDLSDTVLSARMVNVGVIKQRLERGVRETCRMTDKLATLTFGGADILVDGDVLNALIDPLLHVLRNAVDHGIESREERIQAGKPASGQLHLEFLREGDNVVVRCSDDGRGFDLRAIRSAAQQRGLLDGEAMRTDRELFQYTVLPGFSTRADATQVSGRGIGMDVVNKAIADLKGELDISSQPDRGACVTIRVPLTLISMHVLLVRSDERVFGVPSGSLEQVLFSDAGTVQQIDSDLIFTIEQSEYQVRFLSELTGQSASQARGEINSKVMPLLLLQADSGPTAVFVDAAVDGRYLVVKTLGELTPKPDGVIGASILGDGSVAPVLDLRVLLRHVSAPADLLPTDTTHEGDGEGQRAPEILIVDDSLTARRMLSITIADGGYRVRTAIDGLDAIEAIEDECPDVLVTDLEMPRMNGLELCAHLRTSVATNELPVLMVTSRSTEKHRVQADSAGINDFITKPYSNEELLDAIARLLQGVHA